MNSILPDNILRIRMALLLSAIMIMAYVFMPFQAEDVVLTGDIADDFSHPWRFVSYIFVHVSSSHIALNILVLIAVTFYCRAGEIPVLMSFFAGGILGGIVYMLFIGAAGSSAMLAGSSAAVFSAAACSAVASRKYWLIVLIIPAVMAGLFTHNGGGVIAHLAGFLSGVACGFVFSGRRSEVSADVLKVQVSGFMSLSEDERRRLIGSDK